MKPIRIAEDNLDKLADALATINRDKRAHVFYAADLVALAKQAEENLLRLVRRKKNSAGAHYVAVSAEPVSQSYSYRRTANQATFERRSDAWFLIALELCDIRWYQGGATELILTQLQDTAAVAHLRDGYSVARSHQCRLPGFSARSVARVSRLRAPIRGIVLASSVAPCRHRR